MKKNFVHINSMEYLRHLLSKKIVDLSIEDAVGVSMERAQKNSLMVCLQRKQGSGKSTGIASYVIGRPYCYYIKIGPSYAIGNILDEMIFLISGETATSHSSNWAKVKQISKLLTDTADKKLYVVDDCTHLSFRQLSHFQELRDNTQLTTSFVFVAPPTFRQRLEKALSKGIAGAGEVHRRFQAWIDLPGLTKTDRTKYCNEKGLTDDELKTVSNSTATTVAELEILVDQILETRNFKKK